MRRARLGSLLAAAAAGAVLAVAGCGGDDSDEPATSSGEPAANVNFTRGLSGEEREVAATVEDYWEAFLDGDAERLCGLTSTSDADLERCEDALSDFTPRRQPSYRLSDPRVRGENASAQLVAVSGKGEPVTFTLRRIDGEWKVLTVSLPTI